ncbi:YadA-like family protein [Gallibacterium anatis]|uniref:YadA-like family protein n=1 Tax=Gallibacterium anatis TaxID=750 RepID=UPI000BA0A31C|nr:YadA-like family protein [Gallibacterium anatis]WAX70832.1 YadA-like family protein [Gallibacterium anatis]
MNKIYKVIFNRNKNRYEIVSELASSRGGKCKVKAGKQIAKLFMTGLLTTFLSGVALAADQEVKVKYDAATGTIKIVKTNDESQVLASYAVGGNISSIDPNTGTNPTGNISLGQGSKVLQKNTIAIGTDAHAGDANGSVTQSDGKIAIGNKTVASGERSIALGNQSTTNNGSYNIVQGRDSIGIGTSTSVFGYSGVSIGRRNIIGIPDPKKVSPEGVLTTKSQNKSYGEEDPGGNSVIVGAYNVAYGSRSSIIGTYSRAMGNNSVAIGSGVQSLSDGAIAIGKGSGYEFADGSRFKNEEDVTGDFYGRDWELPPEYKVLKQVLSNDIKGDTRYKKPSGRRSEYRYENGGTLPKYNNYGAGSSDPGGFIVEGKNALGIGTYTQVRGDSAIGLATGEMTVDLPKEDKDKSQYARDMRKIMDMEETLYDAKEALKSGSTSDKATLEDNVKTAEESLAAAKKEFRKKYLSEYSFVEGNGALGVGRQILAQGDRSMAVGDYAKAISNDAIAYGGQTLANGTNSMAMGGNAHVGTENEKDAFANSMAIGSHTNVQASNAVALGAFSEVTGENSLALGFGKQSGDDINYNAVSGKNSTLIGSYGNIAGNNSILIGSSGSIANDRVVGLGNNINIAAADSDDQENNTAGSVFLGDHAGYVTDSKRVRSLGKVDVVGSNEKMELTESLSSTKGALRDYTKDFIYIYMLEKQDDGTQIGAPIAVRSDFAGGDSTVGVVSVGSTYEQNFKNIDEIREYHTKVGSLITVPVDVEVEVTKNGIKLGKQNQTRYFAADATQEQINSDSTLSDEDKKKVWNTIQESRKKADTKYTVFETRRIQNVAPGLIGSNSTDAINGSQLFATNQMLGNLVGSLKKALGDNVTITPDGQIDTKDEDDTPFTLGWIAKAGSVKDSNGTVAYEVDKAEGETEEANKEKVNKLKSTGYVVDAAKTMTFKAGKNIGLVQKPGELSISTIDMPSFKSVELRGETKEVNGSQETPVTMLDSNGMQVYTETVTPGDAGPTTTKKVSTTVNNKGVTTDGTVKVTNGKDGNQAKEFVTIDKGKDGPGTDKEYGKIGLDGKNGSNATITVDRVTSSLDDTKNIGTDPNQDISKDNPAKMDRITYTTKSKDSNDVITHEVATMDDGLFFSGDSADGVAAADGTDKNTFARKLSQETKIVGGVDLGLQTGATAEERKKAIADKLTDGNIGVISDGSDTLTVKLAKNLMGLDSTTYTSPTTKTDDGNATSTMKVDGNGIRFVGDNNAVKNTPTFTTDGITGGNKTITDVASGIGGKVVDPDHNDSNTFLENVNKIGKKDGDQPAADAISENVVVNAKDLNNLVDTGFKLNTSGQGNAGATTVKIGDTINVANGVNTKVSAIDDTVNGTHTFHIDVNGLPMSYVDNQGKPLTKIGDTFYRTKELVDGKPPAGAKGVPDTEVTSNVTMLDKNGKNVEAPQIKNVGSGLVNGNNKAMSPSDLLNTADNNPVLKNAVNAGDLKQVAAAVKTEVTGTGKAIVTQTEGDKGQAIYNVHVDPVIDVVGTDGSKVVRGGDGKYYNPTAIQGKTFVSNGQGGGSWYNDDDVVNGVLTENATPQVVTPADVKNSFVNPNSNESIVVDNVKSGIGGEVGDPSKNKPNTFLENVNKVGATTDGISENIVVNAKDLKNLVDTGFKLNTSGQPTAPGATTVKIGDTINVINGVNTKVSAIDDTVNGTHTFHIDVTGMPISYTDNQGNALTKIGDKYYKSNEVVNGKPIDTATEVPADEVTNNIKVINKDGTTNNQGTISNVKSVFDSNIGNGADTGSKIDEIKDGSVIPNTGSNQFINDLTKLNDQVDPKATDAEAEKIRAKKDEEKLNSVSTVRDLQKVALTPLFFEGDTAESATTKNAFGRKLSEKAKIVGGQKDVNQLTDDNIGVVSNGTDTLTIKLAKNLVNLTSVETGSGNNKTKMTENGITTTVKDGDTFKVTTTTPNGLATTEVKLDSEGMPKGESTTTMVTTDGVTITTQTPKNGDKPASTTETKLSKDGLATDGTIKVTGDNAKDLVTIAKGTETDQNATDKEFGTVTIDGKNDSKATLTVDRGTKSVTDSANVGKDPTKPINKDNPVAGMDRLTYTTTGIGDNTIEHQVATLDDGFFLTTEHTKADKTRTVLFNNTIKVLDGANTKVSAMGGEDGTHTFSIDVTGLPMTYTATDANGKTQDVHKVGDTYTLADGTKLVQVGDKFYKPDQVEEVNGTPQVKADQEDKDTKLNNISLTSPVANTAPTLSNVGSALKKSDGTRITMSNLDDSSVYPTNNPIWNNAVNVGDLKAATDAARTEVTGTGKAIVTKKTGDQGQNIYNVHVDPIVDVVGADGSKVVRGDDGKYYNPTDIANKTYIPNADGNGGNWYDNGDLTNGVPNQGAKPQNVTPTDVKNNFVNPNGTDSIVLDNVKSGIGGEVKDAAGKNTFIDNINKVGKKNPDGTVAPDAISENTVVNAKDLKNVVDTGFKLNTSGHSGNAQTVKIGETIKVVDGANTKVSDITPKDGVHEFHIDVTGLPMTYTVSQTGGTDAPVSVSKVGDTYQLADGTKLVKVGDKFYKPSQLVDPKAEQPQVKPEEENKDWTVNDSISLVNKEGSNNAPTTLKNVGSGLKDANGNSTTLDQAVGSNAVNVDDLRTLGKAATTEVTGTGAAEVTKVTGADGQNIYNVHVERFMQVAETDVEGNKVVKAADNHYYKEADIKDKTYIDGQWYNNTDIKDKTKIGDKWYNADDVVNGVPKPNATELTVKATTAPNKAVGLQNNLINPNDNKPTRLSNLASALSGEVGNGANTADNSAINGIDKNGKPTSESGNNTFVKNVLDLDATEKTVEQLKTSLGHEPSEDEVKAEKARAEKDKALLNSAVTVADLQKTLQSPLFFEGDSADGVANENDSDKNTFARKLSQKTKIVGGVDLGLKENATAEDRKKAIAEKLSDNNIGVVSNGTDTLTIKLAKNLVNLTSVETGSGDNKTKMTENGITTTVKDGDTFKVTTTTPNGLATTEVKLDSNKMPTGESKTTTVTTDGVTITTQTPKNGDKPASTTETKLSKDGLATDGTIKVTGDNAKDLVTIGKGTETDPNATDKEFGTVAIDGKNGSNATLTVDRGTKSVTDKANILKDPKQPAGDNNPVSMDRLTYTTTGADGKSIINHEVATLDDGFFLTTEHTEANKTRTVLFNNTIKVLDGANTKVSAMGGKDGTHTFSIDVTGLPVTYTATKTDAKGAPTGEPVDVSKVGNTYQLADGTKLEKVGDKYYTPDQLENGQPKPNAEGLTIKQSVSLVQDNGAPATLERVGSGRRNGMNAKDTPMDWNSILNAAADNAEVNNMLTNAANIGDVRDAIKSITNGTSDNATGGFGLTGNNGDVKQDLGKTITIKGGIETKHDAATNKDIPAKSTTDKNTYVNVKDVPNADGKGSHKEMVIEIAKDLTDLDSVTVGSVDPTTGKGETTKITGKDVTIKDKAGNANTSTATKDELTNANGDKTTVEAGKVDVSKKNADGTTSNTNIDGSKITLENKDKDSNTVGSKTDIGTDGIRITYKDDKGKTDPKKDVSLTDKGLNNGGNQIKNVGSGLVDKNGKDITDISNITDSDILSNGVNVGDLKQAINSVTNSSNGGGFGLKGNNGEIMQNLGETITIKGGIDNKMDDSGKKLPAKSTTDKNTYVNVKNNEMVVEIAKDLTDLDSVTIGNVDEKGNGGTVINKDSMTVKDKDGKNSTNIGAGTIGTSKTDGNGNTSSTNIDGSTITLENKDKDGKTVGSKTDIGTDGIKITYKDDKGNVDPKKDVSLTDKGLNNGGNQIKNVGSGLVDKNGKDITDISNITDSDILSNGVNVKDLQSVNKKLKDDIINISNQVDDIKNSAPVVYTDAKGKRVSKQGDKFINEDGKTVEPQEIKLSLVNVDGKPSTLQNVAKGVNPTDAVNVEQLEEATEKPLTFNGDTGSSSAKLGETVAIKGGANSADLTDNNIGVIADSTTKTLNVKLSKKLKGLESAEFVDNNGNTTNITGDGVHISGGNGSNVSLTSQGLNNGGNRITNVAPGVEATDAVNVSQLNQVGAALHNRINNVAKGAYGGVASAGAMASLPQAYLPGKSMVAAGASHYRGESAVALGTSRISDNGKIILKLNASHNTSGNTMVGAGVGYQF